MLCAMRMMGSSRRRKWRTRVCTSDGWKTSSGAEDALCDITDELKKAPGWWALEVLPFIDSNQDEHGHWKNSLRYVLFPSFLPFARFSCSCVNILPDSINFFRPRNIPRPPDHSNPNSRYNTSTAGVSISDAPALFHISVKHRMMMLEEKKSSDTRSFWRKKATKYKPRAWPPAGEPVFVE